MWDNVKTRSLCLANPRLALLNKLMGDSQARRVPLSFTCFNLPDAFDFYYSKQQMTKVNSSWFRYIHHMDVYIYILSRHQNQLPTPGAKIGYRRFLLGVLSLYSIWFKSALNTTTMRRNCVSSRFPRNCCSSRFPKLASSKTSILKKKIFVPFFARICRVLFLLLGWYFRKNANGIK